MSYKIVITSAFEKAAKPLLKKYDSLSDELRNLFDNLEKDPVQGIPLGNDCYKIRLQIKSKNKGKSGGARVITYIKVIFGRIYLLSIYDKSDKVSISAKELKQLIKSV